MWRTAKRTGLGLLVILGTVSSAGCGSVRHSETAAAPVPPSVERYDGRLVDIHAVQWVQANVKDGGRTVEVYFHIDLDGCCRLADVAADEGVDLVTVTVLVGRLETASPPGVRCPNARTMGRSSVALRGPLGGRRLGDGAIDHIHVAGSEHVPNHSHAPAEQVPAAC
jgi:hypothetical protein